VVAAAVVEAQRPGPKYSENRTSRVRRTTRYIELPHRIQTQATRGDGKVRDRIDFMFTTTAWPRYRCSYFQKDSSSVEYFKYRVGIAGITEFTGDTWSLANVVSRIRLADRNALEWTSMLPATVVTNTDGSTFKQYSTSINGKLLQSGATVTLTARSAEGFGAATDSSGDVSVYTGANVLKFDIIVSNYSYTQPVGQSKLAIVTVTQSISSRERRSFDKNDTEGAFDLGNGGSFVWFNRAWHKYRNGTQGWQSITSTVGSGDLTSEFSTTQSDDDGDATETTDVVIHVLDGSDQHPFEIEWDPTLQIEETANSGNARFILSKWIIVMLSAVGIVVLV